jgi:hypothetical protein
MAWKTTIDRAKRALNRGKRATSAAGEFVREEMEQIRSGKHGARSPQRAIAIALSKARRSGVALRASKPGATSRRTRRTAERAFEVGQGERAVRAPSRTRSKTIRRALDREPQSATSPRKLARPVKRTSRAAVRKTERSRTTARQRKAAR